MSLTTRDTAKMLDLKKRIENLSAADQLRFCAGLLDQSNDAVNRSIVETLCGNVLDALRAKRLFGSLRDE